jgi:hypothetical protein
MNIQENKHIWLAYKNFSKDCNVSHIGLGVTAAYSAKSLIQAGYYAQAVPIFGADDLMNQLRKVTGPPVTHVVIMAQFIPAIWLQKLCRAFPFIKFAQNCHSNVGFLQAEPKAIELLRAAIDIESGNPNFFACGNNRRFCHIISDMYGRQIQFLPNLYYLDGYEPIHRPIWQGGTLRIGCFGSMRVYKNFSTAIAAAVEVGFQLRVPVEIWVNSGRSDGAGNIVFQTASAWTKGLPTVSLKELPWCTWPEFKRFAGTMNIMLQPSYTETFNNVTADGVAEGVASVVSDAIDWAPSTWVASNDDPKDVARVARQLLYDVHAVKDGYAALKKYRDDGLVVWQHFLNRP